jgi:hypothetical protein
MKLYLLNIILAIVMISGFSYAQDFEFQKQQIDKAHQNVLIIKQNFRKALMKAVSEKGAVGALGECKIMAPKLGEKSEKLEIGRTSHKLRNPLNQPREWVKPILQKYVQSPKNKHEPYQIVALGKGHVGYVEPIYVEPLCLNCHGAGISANVKKEISQIYPQDLATGFKVGDFRGLIWLESTEP